MYLKDNQSFATKSSLSLYLPPLLKQDFQNLEALPFDTLVDQTTLLLITRLPVASMVSVLDEPLIGLHLFATQTTVRTAIFLYQIPR